MQRDLLRLLVLCGMVFSQQLEKECWQLLAERAWMCQIRGTSQFCPGWLLHFVAVMGWDVFICFQTFISWKYRESWMLWYASRCLECEVSGGEGIGLSWNPRNPMESTHITYPHHCHITVCHAAAEVRGLVSCAQWAACRNPCRWMRSWWVGHDSEWLRDTTRLWASWSISNHDMQIWFCCRYCPKGATAIHLIILILSYQAEHPNRTCWMLLASPELTQETVRLHKSYHEAWINMSYLSYRDAVNEMFRQVTRLRIELWTILFLICIHLTLVVCSGVGVWMFGWMPAEGPPHGMKSWTQFRSIPLV